MERAEYHRHSRARMAETARRRVETSSAGRAGAHRPSEALHPTRSSDVLPRLGRERVPTGQDVAKTRRKCATPDRADKPILNATTSPLYARRYTKASSPRR